MHHPFGLRLWILAVMIALTPSVSSADLVKMDLLGGTGDFEYCGDTRWNVYGHPDYDFDTQSGWVGDYRSTFTIKASVVRRTAGAGAGDTVTVTCVSSSGLGTSAVTYEFTDGYGSRPGFVQVNLGTDASPANAAVRLSAAIAANQSTAAVGAVRTSAANGVVYVAPNLHWELTGFADSDASDTRIASSHSTWRYGFNPATPDDSVAVGWVRKSGETVNPALHTVYRIAPRAGINGSNCQYFGLRNYSGNRASIYLSANINVSEMPSAVHVGDTVVFAVDRILASGFDSIPAGTTVSCSVGVRLGDTPIERPVSVSGSAVTAEVVVGPIASNIRDLSVYVRIDFTGSLGAREVGAYVDGAHLFIRRAGQSDFAKWQVPVAINRSCRTHKMFAQPGVKSDVYQLASDYDVLMMSEAASSTVPMLRYLNPAIKLYLYESVTSTDFRDARGLDPWYANCPMQIGYIVKTGHTGWLYPNGAGGYVNEPEYTYSYYTRLSDQQFRGAWVQRARDAALRWRYDGVWIDALSEVAGVVSGGKVIKPQRDLWEVQQFLHGIVPVLNTAGLDVVHNMCGKSLIAEPGRIYLDPFWVPAAPLSPPQYAANGPGTVANCFFQEWAFFRFDYDADRNVYDAAYWRTSLDDMDAVRAWNTASGGSALAPEQRKSYDVMILGVDSPADPAAGQDGWLQFGLCSYLLAENTWTALGYGLRSGNAASIDLSITKELGAPSGDHQPYNGDQYCRYRSYQATADGGVGGVVVVNANTNASRTFTVDFDAVDQSGKPVPAGTQVTLKPHTGRIFLRGQSKLDLNVNVPTHSIRSGQVVDIVVSYSNNGTATAENANVRASVPAQMTYVPGSAEASGGTYESASDSVTWGVGGVAVGKGGFKTFRAKVK